MPEVKRKKNESFEAFLRRTKKRWQQSGKILQAKKIRFFNPKQNKTSLKRSALHRKKKTEEIEYLKKTGQLSDDPKNSYTKRR